MKRPPDMVRVPRGLVRDGDVKRKCGTCTGWRADGEPPPVGRAWGNCHAVEPNAAGAEGAFPRTSANEVCPLWSVRDDALPLIPHGEFRRRLQANCTTVLVGGSPRALCRAHGVAGEPCQRAGCPFSLAERQAAALSRAVAKGPWWRSLAILLGFVTVAPITREEV